MTFETINTPAVLIDLDIAQTNIEQCQSHLGGLGIANRPHIKTHKIPRLARAQTDAGARGITCQKIGEAEVMADAGMDDIFITYNILGPAKLARLQALSERVDLSVTADNLAVVEGLDETFEVSDLPLKVLIECDTGGRRCGVGLAQDAVKLAKRIAEAPGLEFDGLMTYPPYGGSEAATEWLRETATALDKAGHPANRISSGGTPDLWADHDGTIVTEWRAGTYIYNDRSLIARGTCTQDQCAMTVLATVVSVPASDRVVVDAGSKILTTDLFGIEHHGVVLGRPELEVTRVYEEHGIIHMPAAAAPCHVGQTLRIIPNHACVVSNMVDEVHLIRGEAYEGAEPVAARGKLG